eukprot:TRINITY_DN4548_c0_g1_i1.p1 TRINITY_DN4548_c0_g1~~TRINITY_DN4548_c0_g1_i1.p1  ORF type:complete len:419 (+),score=91.73 TRINITY_DN4548_c0_g1_i1:1216-2472(+)
MEEKVGEVKDWLELVVFGDRIELCVRGLKGSERVDLSEDEDFKRLELVLDDKGFFSSLVIHVNSTEFSLDRPSIRYDKESESFVYVCLSKSARHDRSVDLEALNEEILFDFGDDNLVFGFAVHKPTKYFHPALLDLLKADRTPIPISTQTEGTQLKQNTKKKTKVKIKTEPSAPAPDKDKKSYERPPFLHAVVSGDLEQVKALYAENPKVGELIDGKGGNASTLAAGFGHLHVLEWIGGVGTIPLNFRRNDGATGVILAALHGHLEVVQWLEKRGVSLEEEDNAGDSTIMHAAAGGNEALVRWLIEEKKVNFRKQSRSGSNALHRAATGGHQGIVKLMIDLGLGVDDVTSRGATATHYALRNGHTSLCIWLVEVAGASPYLKDNKGEDLFSISRKMANTAFTEWLEHFTSQKDPQKPT